MDIETFLFYTYSKAVTSSATAPNCDSTRVFQHSQPAFSSVSKWREKIMIIDSARLNGPCSCGREHVMVTKEAVIEAGCMEKLDFYAAKYGLTGRRAVVYDENTYRAKNLVRPRADQEIVLNPENLHANEIAVSMLREKLQPGISYLVAVGSGTIHDTTRYCANELGIPFVSCPTAASVDGFCSTVSAMTWKGYKKTMPGVAPLFVLADTDIIKEAPLYLALSGAGDIFGKYTALADWKIAHALTGEYFCPVIEKMTRQAVEAVYSCCRGLKTGDASAFEQLTYALILSGLAMQLMGNSRPASGCEHHISHLIEMGPAAFAFSSDALHGEKVGVGTILASRVYHQLGQISDISSQVHEYAFPEESVIRSFYGEKLAPSILEENRKDCMAGVTPDMLIRTWPEIRSIIAEIPDADSLYALYEEIGAKKTLSDIQVPEEALSDLLRFSPTARNRLTLMRGRWMIREE